MSSQEAVREFLRYSSALERIDREEALEKCFQPETGIPYFVRNFVYTQDQAEHRIGVRKIKAAPYDLLPYVPFLLNEMERIPYFDEETDNYIRCLSVPKSRRLWMTWLFCSYICGHALFRSHRRDFCMSVDKVASNVLVNDKCWFIISHLPKWFLANWEIEHVAANPTAMVKIKSFRGEEHNSQILAVPQGEEQMLGETPSLIFIDEMGDQNQLENVIGRYWPMTQPSESGVPGGKFFGVGAARVGSYYQKFLGY